MNTRWLLIALGVSLALNLALAGFLVGRAAGPPPFLRPSPANFDPAAGLGRLLRFLPEDRRSEVLDGIARRDIRKSLGSVRRTQRTLAEHLSQEPFDEQALAATLGRFREQFAASQAASHAAFVAAAARMTPAERQRFVATMRKGPRGRRGDGPARDRSERSARTKAREGGVEISDSAGPPAPEPRER